MQCILNHILGVHGLCESSPDRSQGTLAIAISTPDLRVGTEHKKQSGEQNGKHSQSKIGKE